jgi:peptide deformylase
MKIVKYPHPALRVAAQPVTAIDKDIQSAAAQMLEAMYASEGLGIAEELVDVKVCMVVFILMW